MREFRAVDCWWDERKGDYAEIGFGLEEVVKGTQLYHSIDGVVVYEEEMLLQWEVVLLWEENQPIDV